MNPLKKFVFLSIILLFLSDSINYANAVGAPFYTAEKYSGQWNLDYNGWWGGGIGARSLKDVNSTRNTGGMKGNISNEIGIKWKHFTQGKDPDPALSVAGYDINGNGKENIIFGYDGKIYLGDIESGTIVWESKILDIATILGIEDIKGTGEKSIVVMLSNTSPHAQNSYVGVISGLTGELEWMSKNLSGPKKTFAWSSSRVLKYDIDKDGVNEYHIRSWYSKYTGIKLSLSGSTVVGDTYFDSNYNYGGGWEGYSPSMFGIGKIGGKYVVGAIGTGPKAYGNDLSYQLYSFEKLNNENPYVMKNYDSVFNFGGISWDGGEGYFYDINNDGSDENILHLSPQNHDGIKRYSTVVFSGLNSSGSFVSYWAYSHENFNNNISTPFFLKNQLQPSDSYVVFNGVDKNDGVYKTLFLDYKGANSQDYKKNHGNVDNSSFNYKIAGSYNGSNGTIAGLFNNGNKEYAVLRNGSKYKFYTFTGTGTFNLDSPLEITGSYSDILREFDSNSQSKLSINFLSADTNKNGFNEFVVLDQNKYKFYEVKDDGVSLIKEIQYLGSITGETILKRGITPDLKNIYIITRNVANNTIEYYRSDIDSEVTDVIKKTSGGFNSGGGSSRMLISKLGDYNKLMFSYNGGMYDARNTSPTNPPTKIGNGYYESTDLNGQGINLVSGPGGKAYEWKGIDVNGDSILQEKYPVFYTHGDYNGDGVLDFGGLTNDYVDGYISATWLHVRSGVDGSYIVPKFKLSINTYAFYGGDKSVGADITGDEIDEIIVRGYWSYTHAFKISGGNVSHIGMSTSGEYSYNPVIPYDLNKDGKEEVIYGYFGTTIVSQDQDGDGFLTNVMPYRNREVSVIHGDWKGVTESVMDYNGKTYIASTGLYSGVQILEVSPNGSNSLKLNKWYLNGIKYNSKQAIYDAGLIPLYHSDALLGDFIGNNTLQLLLTGGDGYIYIISLDGEILKLYNIGSKIVHTIHGDVDGDGILDILISAVDGYIYQITNSSLASPAWVKDGLNYGFDIKTQTDNKKIGVNFSKVNKATGYFVQLYNASEKSPVFDWINVGNGLKACIRSSDIVDENCITAGKTFNLNGKSKYEWRVQAYNTSVTSPSVNSDGFTVLRLEINKKVSLKENLIFQDELTVSPNTLLTYRITLFNDSLNTIGGSGFMNYDIIPAQPVATCTGIIDCRNKNIIITDYMPSKFSYMSNSSVWIIKKVNFNKTEDILAGGDQVSDSYFKRQPQTVLATTQGETLIWQFPENIAIPPGASLELQFDAIAKK